MNRGLAVAILSLAFIFSLPAAQNAPPPASAEEPVYRQPFTLKFKFRDHEYTDPFDKTPYVADNCIYVFANEHFGVHVKVVDGEVSQLSYDKDPSKGDLDVELTIKKSFMVMTILNRMDRTLYMDLFMRVNNKPALFEANKVEFQIKRPNVEFWPYPVEEIALKTPSFRGQQGH